MRDIIRFILSFLCAILIMLPPYLAGRRVMKNTIASNKLIIIDNSSYRCKMVNTLKEK